MNHKMNTKVFVLLETNQPNFAHFGELHHLDNRMIFYMVMCFRDNELLVVIIWAIYVCGDVIPQTGQGLSLGLCQRQRNPLYYTRVCIGLFSLQATLRRHRRMTKLSQVAKGPLQSHCHWDLHPEVQRISWAD